MRYVTFNYFQLKLRLLVVMKNFKTAYILCPIGYAKFYDIEPNLHVFIRTFHFM